MDLPATRYVYVTLIGEEIDYVERPTDRPALRVKIIRRNRGGSVVEKTFTFDDENGNPVAPPGTGWVFKETVGHSSVWLRIREHR